jgi:hypothetical protein
MSTEALMAKQTVYYADIVEGWYGAPDTHLHRYVQKVRRFVSAKRPIEAIMASIVGALNGGSQPDEFTLAMFTTLAKRADCTFMHLIRLYVEACPGDPNDFDELWEFDSSSERPGSFFDRAAQNATFEEWIEALRYIVKETLDDEHRSRTLPELLKYGVPALGPKTRAFALDGLHSVFYLGVHSVTGIFEEKEWYACFDALVLCHKAEQTT